MPDPLESVVARAAAGDDVARRTLEQELLPVVKARAIAALARWRRDVGEMEQAVEGMTQEVFLSLFANDCQVLRTWNAERGLSLKSFVGLVAQRQVGAILRSGRRTSWPDDPVENEVVEQLGEGTSPPAMSLGERQRGERALQLLRESLSPRGLCMFHSLLVEQQDVGEVARAYAMTETAVYAWQARLRRVARKAWHAASCEPCPGRNAGAR